MEKQRMKKILQIFFFLPNLRKNRLEQTKQGLHEDLKDIQEGKELPHNPKKMRVLSKVIKKEKYGTTRQPPHPRKVTLSSGKEKTINLLKNEQKEK